MANARRFASYRSGPFPLPPASAKNWASRLTARWQRPSNGPLANGKVIAIRRLLSRDAAPVAYHREYLVFDPTRPIVEAEMGITSLQGLFDGQGETVLKRGDLGIQTTVLTEEEARLLDAAIGSAAFRIEHTFFDFDERPVSWGWFIVRGDCLRFNATVGAPYNGAHSPGI